MTMPFMICLMLATGVVIGASTGAAVRIVRAPAMMKPIPLMNSATLTTKSQCTVRIVVALSHVRAPRRDARRDDLHDRHDHKAVASMCQRPTLLCAATSMRRKSGRVAPLLRQSWTLG